MVSAPGQPAASRCQPHQNQGGTAKYPAPSAARHGARLGERRCTGFRLLGSFRNRFGFHRTLWPAKHRNVGTRGQFDHQFTVFAQLLNGMDVVDALLEGDIIERVDILKP